MEYNECNVRSANQLLDNRLKEIREQRQISINQCVKDTGISKRTLKRYENGDVTIAVENMVLLSDYYDCSMDDLFSRSTRKKCGEMER